MEQKPMLEFVKALANTDRLRVLGVLAQKPTSTEEISQTLGLHPQDAQQLLALLAEGGVIAEQQGLWQIDSRNMKDLSQRQNFERERYVPALDLSETSRKVLIAYLNADGTIKQLPTKASKLQILLDYVLESFDPGVRYTEKEVNMILRRFHIDTAGLRRDLIDRGMLQRISDGSQYWRPE